ncbi:hypothetical protein [Nocardia alba]|uniref:Uncharacterized protein n=1 Tax=Nocardia alba TaxID=225051 RepID=A0A4R1F8M5_9NOCA|nr:hypothetical protein [Nocardia alba]TCJ89950.1 hypothetical protein DFR71_6240 [Nocardia alba]
MDERPDDAIAAGGQATASSDQMEGIDSGPAFIADWDNRGQTTRLRYMDENKSQWTLQYDMPFMMWWLPRTGDMYYPVGLWDGKDAMPKDQVSKADIVQWRIRGPHSLEHPEDPQMGGHLFWPLQWRQGTGVWKDVHQRKGANYYLSVDGHTTMRGVRYVKQYGTPYYAFYMDIVTKGDAWISDETTTGSIRMQSSESRRAYIVPRRFGSSMDDPFGSATTFYKSTLAGIA